jgi:hypothetical protein
MKKVFVCSLSNLAGQPISPTTFEVCESHDALLPVSRARIMIERNKPGRYRYDFGTITVEDNVAAQMEQQGYTICEESP